MVNCSSLPSSEGFPKCWTLSAKAETNQNKWATLMNGSHVKEVSGLAENPRAPYGILMLRNIERSGPRVGRSSALMPSSEPLGTNWPCWALVPPEDLDKFAF